MAKVRTFKLPASIKTVGESISHVAKETIKGQSPILNDYVSSTTETFKEIQDKAKETRTNSPKALDKIKKLPFVGDAKTILENAKSDLKNGKFVNNERIDSSDGFGFDGDDFGMDFDMDFDMDSDMDSDSSSSSSPSNSSSEESSGDKIVKNIKNTVINTSTDGKALPAVTNSFARISTANTQALGETFLGGISHMTTNMMSIGRETNSILDKLVTGVNTLSEFNNNSILPFQEKIINVNNGRLDILKSIEGNIIELKDSQLKFYSDQKKFAERKDASDGVVGIDGTLDFKGYGGKVVKNLKEELNNQTAGALSLLGTMNGMGNPLQGVIDSPLSYATTMAITTLLPVVIKKSTESFNKALEGFAPAMLMKINGMAKGKGELSEISKILSKVLGINLENKRTINLDKYEKGPIPFDGVTKKAIVDVIPMLLSKIHKAVTKSDDEYIVDYSRGGTLELKSQKQLEYEERKKELGFSSLDVLADKFYEMFDTKVFKSLEEEANYKEDIELLKRKLIDEGSMVDFNKYNKDELYKENLGRGLNNRDMLDEFMSEFKNMSKENQILANKEIMEANIDASNQMRRYEHEASINGYAQLLAGEKSTYNENIKKPTSITSVSNKLNPSHDGVKDEDYYNSDFYAKQHRKMQNKYDKLDWDSYNKKNSLSLISDKVNTTKTVKEIKGKLDNKIEKATKPLDTLINSATSAIYGTLYGFDGDNPSGKLKRIKDKLVGEKIEESNERSGGVLSNIINKTNSVMDNMKLRLFGKKDEETGKREGGLLPTISKQIKSKFEDASTYLKLKLFGEEDPEDGKRKGGYLTNLYDTVNKKFTNITDSLRLKLLGTKNKETGKYEDGLLTNFRNDMQDKFTILSEKVKHKLFGDKDKETGKRSGGLLSETMNKIQDKFTILSEKVKHKLFGEEDKETGKRSGGLLSETMNKIQDKFTKTTDFLKLKLLGEEDKETGKRSGGYLTNILDNVKQKFNEYSEKAKYKLFGKKDDDTGKRSGGLLSKMMNNVQEKFTDIKDKVALKLLGEKDQESGKRSGGLLSTMVNGVKKKFDEVGTGIKHYLLGDGDKKKGVLTQMGHLLNAELVQPFKKFARTTFDNAKNFLNEKVMIPVKKAFAPIVNEVKYIFTDVKDKVVDTFKTITGHFKEIISTHIAKPMKNFFDENLFKPMKKHLKKAFEGVAGVLKKIITAPVGLLTGFSNKLAEKHRQEGRDGYQQDWNKKGKILDVKEKIRQARSKKKLDSANAESDRNQANALKSFRGLQQSAKADYSERMKAYTEKKAILDEKRKNITPLSEKLGIKNPIESIKDKKTSVANLFKSSPLDTKKTFGPEVAKEGDNTNFSMINSTKPKMGLKLSNPLKNLPSKEELKTKVLSEKRRNNFFKKMKPAEVTVPLKKISANTTSIKREISGQLNGVGNNIAKIYNALKKKFGIKDDSKVKGLRNKKRQNIFQKIKGDFQKKVEDIKKGFKDKIKSTVDFIKKPFVLAKKGIQGFVKGVGTAGKNLVKGTVAVTKGLAKGVGSTIKFLGSGTKTLLNGAFKGVAKTAEGLGKGLQIAFEGAGKVLKGGFNIVGEVFKGGAKVIKGSFGIVESGLKGIGNLTKKVVPLIGDALGDVAKGIYTVGKKIISTGFNIVKGVTKRIAGGIKTVFTGQTEKNVVNIKNSRKKPLYVYAVGGVIDQVRSVGNDVSASPYTPSFIPSELDEDSEVIKYLKKINKNTLKISKEVDGQLNGVGYHLSKIWSSIKKEFGGSDSDVADTITNKKFRTGGQKVLDAIKGKFSQPIDFVKDKIQSVKDNFQHYKDEAHFKLLQGKEVLQNIKDEIHFKFLQVDEKVKSIIPNVKEKLQHYKDEAHFKLLQVKEKLQEVKDEAHFKLLQVKEGFDSIKEKLRGKIQGVKDNFQHYKDEAHFKLLQVKEGLQNIKDEAHFKLLQVKEKIQGIKDEAHFKLLQFKEKIQDKFLNMKEKFQDFKKGFKEKFQDKFLNMKEKFQDFKKGFKEKFQYIKEKFQDKFLNMKEKFQDFKKGFKEKFQDFNLLQFKESIPAIKERIAEGVTAFTDGFKDTIGKVKNTIKNVSKNLLNMGKNLVKSGINIAKSIGGKIKDTIGKVKNSIKNLGNSIKNVSKNLLNMGKNLVKSGINIAKSIGGKIKDTAIAVKDKLASKFMNGAEGAGNIIKMSKIGTTKINPMYVNVVNGSFGQMAAGTDYIPGSAAAQNKKADIIKIADLRQKALGAQISTAESTKKTAFAFSKKGIFGRGMGFLKGILGKIGFAITAIGAGFASKKIFDFVGDVKEKGFLGAGKDLLFGPKTKGSWFNEDGTKKSGLQKASDDFQFARYGRHVGKKIAKSKGGKIAAKIGGKLGKAGGKVLGKGAKLAKAGVSKITGLVTKLVSNPKIASKLGGAKGIGQVVKKFAGKFAAKGAGKGIGKALAKYANPVIGGAMFAGDFATGAADAKRIFKLPKDSKPTAGMRMTSGLTRALSGLAFGLVPENWLANTIYKFIGSDEDKAKLAEMQQMMKDQAVAAGMDIDAFNEQQNVGIMGKVKNLFKRKSPEEKKAAKEARDAKRVERKKAFKATTEKIKAKFSKLGTDSINNLNAFLVEPVKKGFNFVKEKVGGAFSTVKDKLTSIFTGDNIIGNTIDGIKNSIKSTFDNVSNIFNTIKNAILSPKETIEKLTTKVKEGFTSFSRIFGDMVSFIKDPLGSIKNFFGKEEEIKLDENGNPIPEKAEPGGFFSKLKNFFKKEEAPIDDMTSNPYSHYMTGTQGFNTGGIVKFKDLEQYNNGGIPSGPTTGDKKLVRVNGGEMILNQKQQANLLDLFGELDGGDITVNSNGSIIGTPLDTYYRDAKYAANEAKISADLSKNPELYNMEAIVTILKDIRESNREIADKEMEVNLNNVNQIAIDPKDFPKESNKENINQHLVKSTTQNIFLGKMEQSRKNISNGIKRDVNRVASGA